jgi:hypothetical protein
MLLALLSRKWLDTSLPLLELTPVLSHLLAVALGFELQVGGSENIWLISGVVLRPHIPVVTCMYITFGDDGQGRVNCEEMIKVSNFVTFECVALVKPLGLFRSLPHLMCKVSFVCILTLMHEFRGEVVCFMCSLPYHVY